MHKINLFILFNLILYSTTILSGPRYSRIQTGSPEDIKQQELMILKQYTFQQLFKSEVVWFTSAILAAQGFDYYFYSPFTNQTHKIRDSGSGIHWPNFSYKTKLLPLLLEHEQNPTSCCGTLDRKPSRQLLNRLYPLIKELDQRYPPR